jgi:DNA-binding beta-propeller fold protein YncE
MTAVLGEGDFRYRSDTSWGRLPTGWRYGEVAAVGVDSKDNVYVFARGKHPMIVFDRDGNFLRSWGEDIFKQPHGLHIGPDDSIYCTDEGDHTVRRFTPHGRLELEIGVPGVASGFLSGYPFHRCTHTALSPELDIYVADGYGNARVHKYAPNGKLILSWGQPGTGPGEFNIVHNICCDRDGWVYVADRENHRIQVFDSNGRYSGQWNNLHRPCGLCIHGSTNPLFYVGELGPGVQFSNRDWPGIGPRLSIMDKQGNLLARLGDRNSPTVRDSAFISPHGVAVDSQGAIYVGEVSRTTLRGRGVTVDADHDPICLQKLIPEHGRKVQ